ncbi:hypothetical protein [Azohydromonas caseinilytica]|uniref:Uncharacterized protein n=1 Tax=Azohydromonas caseinilytica TaxID=2728836 RepID=A0A848F628_9BURK|nr:hypothetical protein [Azohydromonas caseinilytica]NML15537.1 hypothetical protein [Azohydromonas caseinilytica]
MKTRQLDVARRNFRLACMGSAVLLALAATTASQAATRGDRSAAQQMYRSDVQYCNSGQSSQPRATCLHEARQAYNEALRGGLDVPVMAAGTRSTQSTAASQGTGSGMDQGNRTGTSSAITGSGSSGSSSGGSSSSGSGTGSSYGGATSGGSTGSSSSGMTSGSGMSSGSSSGGGSSGMGSPNTGSASSGNSGSTSDRGQSGSAVSPNGGAPSGGTGSGTGR